MVIYHWFTHDFRVVDLSIVRYVNVDQGISTEKVPVWMSHGDKVRQGVGSNKVVFNGGYNRGENHRKTIGKPIGKWWFNGI